MILGLNSLLKFLCWTEYSYKWKVNKSTQELMQSDPHKGPQQRSERQTNIIKQSQQQKKKKKKKKKRKKKRWQTEFATLSQKGDNYIT